jgi:hypothetical protein
MSNAVVVSVPCQVRRHEGRSCIATFSPEQPLTSYCALQGGIYATIIDRIILEAKNDFEEAGLEQETLQELKQVGGIPRFGSGDSDTSLLSLTSASHIYSSCHTFLFASLLLRPASLV